MSPRPNFWGRLRPALIFELGRIGSEHLPNDLPRDPKLPADRLDRPLLNEIRPADLRNRLHDQHPELGLHVPWKPVWTLIPGVPFGCRSPRKRGPYSTPIHTESPRTRFFTFKRAGSRSWSIRTRVRKRSSGFWK